MSLVSFKMIGVQAMLKRMSPAVTSKPAASQLLKQLTLAFERDVKKATVVDTGRARASIVSDVKPMQGEVSTNVKYFPAIEYGTSRMQARHMEGSSKKLGEGAFHYVSRNFKKTSDGIASEIATKLESSWGR